MAITSADTQQNFTFPYEQVFDGLVAILGPAGFEIKTQDRVIGRITAGAGMSAFSWGEDVVLQIQKRGDDTTELTIQSNLKVGFNLTGTAKNTQNAERIIGALSAYLQGGSTDVAASVAAAPTTQYSPVLWIVVIIVGLAILFAMLSE